MRSAGSHDSNNVAVIGYAARLPGADGVAEVWDTLINGKCQVGRIPDDRWSSTRFFDPNRELPGKSYAKHAGLLDRVFDFDAGYFGLSPREAEQMDPQQRILLETVARAFDHAGIDPSTLDRRRTGVFVGASSSDHSTTCLQDPSLIDAQYMLGNTLSIISNRISYHWDIGGPSYTVDTACSSGLFALDQARTAIAAGEVDTAIVASVNVLLSPMPFIGFSKALMLSETGLCQAFSQNADGYVRAEGAVAFVLRKSELARTSHDHIRSFLAATGTNSDGRTAGIAMPSSTRQLDLLERVKSRFGISPDDLAFVEAHGTGTLVGDPEEARAIGMAYGQQRSEPLLIGSAKTNFGHLEPAAGLVGLLKAQLALEHNVLPASLHADELNSNIPFEELGLEVAREARTLPERSEPWCAAVNSFGFGGANAHAVLRQAPRSPRPKVNFPQALLLTAESQNSLRSQVESWSAMAQAGDPDMASSVVDANKRLARHRHRLCVVGGSAEKLAVNLADWLNGDANGSVFEGSAKARQDAKVGFVFSGNGSQWAGMGRYMLLKDSVFRDTFGACSELAIRYGAESLLELIMSPDLAARLDRAPVAQTLLLAVQIAMVDALAARGLKPAAVLGHSAGEVAAAYACGAITMEEAVRIIVARSATLDRLYGTGTMAAVVCDVATAKDIIEASGLDVDIAAENSEKSLTVSGSSEDVAHLLKLCRKKRIVAKRLQIEYPYHSSLTDPLRPRLMEELEGIKGRKTPVPFYSGCMGQQVPGESLDPDFWWTNARHTVRFREGIASMASDGIQMFLEISPKSVLRSYVRDCLSEEGFTGMVLGSLEQTNAERIDATSIALSVLAQGGEIEEDALLGSATPFFGDLPDYPFDRKEYRLASEKQLDLFGRKPHHPVLGNRIAPESNVWTADLSVSRLPWLADHKVDGRVLVPAMAMLELFLAAAAQIPGNGTVELRNLEILRPIQLGNSDLVSIRVTHDVAARRLTIEAKVGGDWVWVAGAALFHADAATPAPIELADGEPREALYQSLSKVGLDYGEAFARAGRLSVSDDVVDVHLADTLLEDAEFELDPTAMDAALHALLPMLQKYQSNAQVVFVPGRMGRVRHFARGRIAGARLKLRSGSVAGICADVAYVDKDRNVLAVVEELRLRPMPLSRGGGVTSWDERTVPIETFSANSPTSTDVSGPGPTEHLASDLQVLRDSIGGRLAWDVVTLESEDNSLDRRHDAAFSALNSIDIATLGEGGDVVLQGDCPWPPMETLLRLLIETEPDAADEIHAALHGMVSDTRNDSAGVDRLRTAALDLLARYEGSLERVLLTGQIEPAVFQYLLANAAYLVVAVETEEDAEALRLNLAGAEQCLVTTIENASSLPGFDLVLSLGGAEVLKPRIQRRLAKLGVDGGRLLLVDYAVDLFEIMTGRYGDAGAVDEFDANLASSGIAGTRAAWTGAPNVTYLSAELRAKAAEPAVAVEVLGEGVFAEALRAVVQAGQPGEIAVVALDADPNGDMPAIVQSDAFRTLPEETNVVWVVQQGLAAEASLRGWRRVLANETGRDIRCMSVEASVDAARVLMLAATSKESELCVTTDGTFAQRLVPAKDSRSAVAADQKLMLTQAAHGRLDELAWSAAPRIQPDDHEVELEVAATALNFRDVMWAQGLLPSDLLEGGFAGPSLGMECSGVVTRAGPKSGFKVGDRAIAFSRDAFATHITVPSEAVIPIPEELDLAAAAAIPVIFVTAEYSLTDLARLKEGEWCLIHGGAGGVGLAAIQVAQQANARIIATAGSAKKRALLRSLGVEHVCDSRSLEFPDFVHDLTDGRGVDVVLNSLAGEAMEQGIGCLAPFGRFIELGKRDFVANTAIGLRALKNNISYFAVDADQLLRHRPEMVRDIMHRVATAFSSGAYYLPPMRSFPSERVGDAFRLMQRSAHVGKILVTPPAIQEASDEEHSGFGGAWLITGGTRGFGLATAEWLAERGARELWLVSRTGKVEDRERVEALSAAGVRVEVRAADLTDEGEVDRLMGEIAISDSSLAGIVNAAAVIEDAMFADTDRDGLARVISAKLSTAELLDRTSRRFDLKHFWLYSSIAARFGNPGQSAYVAANLELEALARRRSAEGLPALAIAWGPIGDAGYLERAVGVKEIIERKLGRTLNAREALDSLETVLREQLGRSTITLATVDWSRLKGDIPVLSEPLFEFLDLRQEPTNSEGLIDLGALIANDGEAKARKYLLDVLRREAAQIMRIAPAEIDVDRELVDLGFDSLMGMSLKMAMEERLGSATPLTSVANGMTLSRLAHAIVTYSAEGKSDSVETTMAERHLTESDLPNEVIAEIANAAVGQSKK